MTAEMAIDLLKGEALPLGVEKLPISKVGGRILSSSVVSPINTPPFNRAPVDGYAIVAEDSTGTSRQHPVRLHVVDKILAGETPRFPLQHGMAMKIMTGAMLPEGATAVIRQEDTDDDNERVSLFKEMKPYENFVYEGEDSEKGIELLPAGLKLGAAEQALLASVGLAEVEVYALPKVVVLSTGSELQRPGEPLKPGKIYNSNYTYLTARLKEMGLTSAVGDMIPDTEEEITAELKKAAETADLIITTGGVSVGEKDLMPMISKKNGRQIFWGVAMKPGSPLLAWKLGNTLVISLSGNPFASSATFEIFVRPVLCVMSNGTIKEMEKTTATMAAPFPKASHGRRYIRGNNVDGKIFVPETHSSGVIRSMVGCNCLIDIPAGTPPLEIDDKVTIWMM